MQKIIAERYEILDLIGQGGMADVYLARDTILNRTIAIKILRTGLAKDPIYVARFQREASAAAALSHKNIVEIYDVGEDNDQYYIVMEYVPGTTLKELINKRGALHVVEAVDIMKQVVAGTTKAHQLGIVHRDLKPQNILVTDSGVAKIADFGIASMQSLAQVTQTDVIMGSLHYLAPELARGEKATNQSDIYALGIVFYELLRGEVPFNGESPVNIALKHMQEELPSIRSFNPSIPQAVENIIIRATAKNLKDRYQSINEMLSDMETCMDKEEEKVVFAYNKNEDPTIALDPRSMYTGKTDEIETIKQPKKTWVDNLLALPLAAKIGIGVGTLAILGLLIFFIFFSGDSKDVNMMPNLLGEKQQDAVELLEKDYQVKVVINEEQIVTDAYEAGKVAASDPKAGSSIKSGDTVTLTISKGKYFKLEDYVGETKEDAIKALEKLGFEVTIEYVTSDKEIGIVVEQGTKKGTKIDPTDENLEITLQVSKGESIVLENYVGMTYDEAYKQLTALGFSVTKDEVESEETVGTVTAQSKKEGTELDPDDNLTITLTVSKGMSYKIDSVVGRNYVDAKSYLESLGYEVRAEEGNVAKAGPDSFMVYEQSVVGTVTSKPSVIVLTYYGAYVEPDTGEE
jgi:serine/threonine-protein kinase